MLPVEPESSWLRGKLVYIIIAVIVIIGLAVGAYFFLGTKKTTTTPVTTPTPVAPASKLSSAWLTQYFNKATCDDQTVCGDKADPDSDGLTNAAEFTAGTNPTLADTDGDGLADGDEVNIYKTDPMLKFTDRRDIVAQNNWTDSYQVKGGYDPNTPNTKFTPTRLQEIADATVKFQLHEPTITSLKPAGADAGAGSPTSGTQQSKTVTASIQSFAFSPTPLTVNKGDMVVWTNKDTAEHTVTGDKGGPNSPNIAQNQTYSYKFDTVGTFTYYCKIHPNMKGTVIVK
jgi:plastocyanin